MITQSTGSFPKPLYFILNTGQNSRHWSKIVASRRTNKIEVIFMEVTLILV